MWKHFFFCQINWDFTLPEVLDRVGVMEKENDTEDRQENIELLL